MKQEKAPISRTSKALRYSGLGIVSLIAGVVSFLYFDSVSGIPDEYVWGDFQLSQMVGRSDVYMIARLEPESPTTIGEEIQVTVFKSDDLQPLPDRIIIVKDSEGNDVGGGWTNSTGQSTITYPGEGTTIRITSDGSYIRDAIIFLPVQEKWVIATQMLYLGSIATGLMVGIGLFPLLRHKHSL